MNEVFHTISNVSVTVILIILVLTVRNMQREFNEMIERFNEWDKAMLSRIWVFRTKHSDFVLKSDPEDSKNINPNGGNA